MSKSSHQKTPSESIEEGISGGGGSHHQSRTMLDKMWTELQSNLPTIELDDDDDDQIVTRDHQLCEFDIDYDDYNNNNNDEDDDQFNSLRRGSGVSISQISISDDKTSSNLMSRLESMGSGGGRSNSGKSSSNKTSKKSLYDSVRSANKITKNIFETTNSSLSMDVLNSINIDEVLESLPRSSDHPDGKKDQVGSRSSDSRAVNDEIIMKKLSEMSLQYKERRDDKKQTSAPSQFNMSSALQMIERELGPTRELPMDEMDEDSKELREFLRAHNIRDGNLTQTRRLDLRAEQNRPLFKPRIYSKPDVESFFESMVLKDDAKQWSQAIKNNKIKFLNDDKTKTSSSSSSESDDSESSESPAAAALWIERYRKQKLTGSHLNQNK